MLLCRAARRVKVNPPHFGGKSSSTHRCCPPHQSHHLAAPCGLRLGSLCGRGTSAALPGLQGPMGRPLLGRSPDGARSPRSQTPSKTLQTPTCTKENSLSILILAKTNTRKTGEGMSQPLREH